MILDRDRIQREGRAQSLLLEPDRDSMNQGRGSLFYATTGAVGRRAVLRVTTMQVQSDLGFTPVRISFEARTI